MYAKAKRIMDVLGSIIVILLLWPLFILIAILIKLESKGSVFFKQRRIGKDKKEFLIYKFRTMSVDAPKDTPTHLLENPEKYITKTGRFIRKSSLDELPQIINILKGDMSFIGPRPALWNQYDLIAEREKYNANSVIPGLTGWAQVNGRDELPIPLKALLDGYYVKNMSLLLDIKIILMTIKNVITGKGIIEGLQVERRKSETIT